jgi:ribosomal protein S18 acetylase RimI-like enzyme
MISALPFDILDLRHFAAANLRSLLEEESRIWSERLHWDYYGSANLLLQYLNSHILPGYVAVENGNILGYIFCVHENTKAVIGDVFASATSKPTEQIESTLLLHLLELLQNSPHVDRIESQILLPPSGTHASTFRSFDCQIYPRLFMEQDLTHEKRTYPLSSIPEELELRLWNDSDLTLAAELITAAYRDHLDSLINDQYCSANGSLRFLHNIVRFPGCGLFDAKASRVLVHRKSGSLIGMLLCSRVRDDVGHVTQLCIHPTFRGHGLARMLLEEVSKMLRHRRFRALSLTVTEDNKKAVELYRSEGFKTIHTFDAVVWEREAAEKRSVGKEIS